MSHESNFPFSGNLVDIHHGFNLISVRMAHVRENRTNTNRNYRICNFKPTLVVSKYAYTTLIVLLFVTWYFVCRFRIFIVDLA